MEARLSVWESSWKCDGGLFVGRNNAIVVPYNKTIFHYMEQSTAIDKAIDVLVHLRTGGQPCGVTQLALALQLPKSSTHRLLSTLVRRGMVERDTRGRYRLGVGLVSLGLGALEQDPLVVAARPILEAEAQALGETCFLVAARAGQLTVLDKAEGTGFLRASPRVGSHVPLHATAAGKLYLALSPEQIRTESTNWQHFTERTLSRAAFEAELALVATQGFAVNKNEWIEGLSVFSAPVFVSKRLVAVLAIALPSGRLGELDSEVIIHRVMDAAARIGARADGRST